jgi:hypothetical protein
MIRSIMDCGEAWLLEVKKLGHTGRTRPPALDAIAQRVLAQFPQLRPGYDAWWANKREKLEAAYLIATDAAGWAMPCAHLCNAAPFMLATHRRNLDEDPTTARSLWRRGADLCGHDPPDYARLNRGREHKKFYLNQYMALMYMFIMFACSDGLCSY